MSKHRIVAGSDNRQIKLVTECNSFMEAASLFEVLKNNPKYVYVQIQMIARATTGTMTWARQQDGGWLWSNMEYWKESEIEAFGKPSISYYIEIPVNLDKNMRMKLGQGWDKRVRELFTTQFGVRFAESFLGKNWTHHHKKKNYLEYRCWIPETAMEPLRKSYACRITKITK